MSLALLRLIAKKRARSERPVIAQVPVDVATYLNHEARLAEPDRIADKCRS